MFAGLEWMSAIMLNMNYAPFHGSVQEKLGTSAEEVAGRNSN